MHQLMANTPRRQHVEATDLAWRVITLVNVYRLLAALGLVVLALAGGARGSATSLEAAWAGAPLLAASLYLLLGLGLALLPRASWAGVNTLIRTQVAADTAGIGTALWAAGGVGSGLGILLVLPIGAMALLAERRDAYALAALAAIGLLVQQALVEGAGGAGAQAGDFVLAGLLGLVLFVVALSVQPVAARLRDSEALVRRQEVDLANLAQLSQYILLHLRESLLVVDADDRIRLANDSAAGLLGLPPEPGAALAQVAPALHQRLAQWRRQGDEGSTLPAADGSRLLQPHFALLGQGGAAPVLVFLEDTTLLAERVQQSKLASLGRLSASIAHEIRTPVGAMSHAAQLLAESPGLGSADQRLTQIIRGNAQRVSQLIDNVLEFSRRGTRQPEQLRLGDWLAGFRSEFCATLQCEPATLALLANDGGAPSAAPAEAWVDPTHLHQILWNLCSNALQHGAPATALEPGEAAVLVRYGRMSGGRPFVEVLDRGPGIAASDQERIFEPFFSRATRGTGLGLYLARELAQANGATLLHEPRPGGGSVFRIVFSDPGRWGSGAP
jgi:two-component system, NtrC family, sensor histidine kinase PilS